MLYKLILSYINTKIEVINTKMMVLMTEGPIWNPLTGWRLQRGIAITFSDSTLESLNAMTTLRPRKKFKKKISVDERGAVW